MTTIALDGAVVAIVEELDRRLGIAVTRDVVECVQRSIDDLRGSTSAESLPEMAFRLARVRLADNSEQVLAEG